MSEKTRKQWFGPILVWGVGILAMVAIWVTVSTWLGAACFWMTLVAVIDMALLLHFSGLAPGWRRFGGIVAGTLIIVSASLWLIASNAFGLSMGLPVVESAQMVGPVLVTEFSRLRMSGADWFYPLAGIALAGYCGFRRPRTENRAPGAMS